MKSPPPDLSFTGFGASSLDFQLQYWIRLSSPGGRIKSDLYFALDAAFRKHGIEMPYPTQDLHVRSWPPPEGRQAGFGADGHAAAGREAKVAEED
jgi:small-conductance mechanosensitive channel